MTKEKAELTQWTNGAHLASHEISRWSSSAIVKHVFPMWLAIISQCALAEPATSQPAFPDSIALERVGGLRGMLRGLFQFSLFAPSVDPDRPEALQLRGLGFAPSVVGRNGLLVDFIESAVAGNLTNIPFTTANASFNVRFEGGTPIVSRGDPGPIVAERAETQGKGRVLVGATYNATRFTSMRGADLSSLRFDFAHVNLQGEACDEEFGGDCDPYGYPAYENDIMQVDLGLDLKISTLSFVFGYGVLDWLDVTVALPITFAELQGTSQAQIIPFSGPPATNYFAGTPEEPQLISQKQFIDGSASGVGDVALRMKARLDNSGSALVAGLIEVRFPTGSEDDLLGAGQLVARALGIASTDFRGFSPHINAGFLYRGGGILAHAVLATAGFSNRLATWATLAIDITAQLQVGDSPLELPETVFLTSPYTREVRPTTISDQRDDIVDAAFGLKFPLPSGLVFVVNSTWPLNKGGVRPNWSLGAAVEYSF